MNLYTHLTVYACIVVEKQLHLRAATFEPPSNMLTIGGGLCLMPHVHWKHIETGRHVILFFTRIELYMHTLYIRHTGHISSCKQLVLCLCVFELGSILQ